MSILPIPVAIIGPGNIGTDLLFKAQRSPWLDPRWSIGVVEESQGLATARERGLQTTHNGLESVIDQLARDGVRIAFDATSAKYHPGHDKLLRERGIQVIDLTPASIGPYCVPSVNLTEHRDEPNLNMVSCGAQATIPMVAAVSRVQPVEYGEIIATVASKSIGPGTRQNIDEFTRTTRAGVEQVGGAKVGKAIIVINPAEPPIIMRDTIHCLTETEPDQEAITASIHAMLAEVQRYVPGYRLKNGPVYDGRRVTVWLEVAGLGDHLPTYAGNLDIMTAAAVRTAELFAEGMQ
jgi:acetaldehyde/propanal dehydrogenase